MIYDTLYLDKFILAFLSLSKVNPQHSHLNILSDNDNLVFTSPQFEHVFDDGYHLSASINLIPYLLLI